MGKIMYSTGQTTIRIGWWDRILFAILTILAIEAALYWADYWFFGGHRVNIFLFILLSYAVFRGVVRSVISWIFFQFIAIPSLHTSTTHRTVDIFTTAMPGEPCDMFRTTLIAMQKITHPHTSYLLDGSDDPQLKSLCSELGVGHINCKGVPGAKAGKINYCLKNFSKAELVLVLDPDHIPEPDFLDRTLPYFNDEKVGFVQVVQAYYNADKNVVAHAAAEQGFGFYGPLQMGLSGLDSAIAIGANCTFRRAALDSIDGHAVHLAEDACTSLRLHAAGWKGRYVPYRASYGLVPEDLASFFKQQIKWAKGMFDLLLHEYPKAFFNLNIQQKIYYLFAGTFYLNGAVTLLTIILPVIFIFFKIYAIEMPISGYFLHITPYVIASLMLSMYIQRWYSAPQEKGFPWRSMFLEKGTWHIYTLALFYSLTGKNIVWIPTPKSGSEKTSITLVLPHIIAILLSCMSIAFVLTTYPRIDSGTQLMMVFAVMNVVSLAPVVFWGLFPKKGCGA